MNCLIFICIIVGIRKTKMKFLSSEHKILYNYLKHNIGWIYLNPNSFQKKCLSQCWVHRFFLKLKFVFEENNFLSRMERHTIAN